MSRFTCQPFQALKLLKSQSILPLVTCAVLAMSQLASANTVDQGPALNDVGEAPAVVAKPVKESVEAKKALLSEIEGVWETIDDKTKKAKSTVEIYAKEGKLYGKVTALLLKPSDTVCKKCKGELKDQLVVGMNIINDMRKLEDGKERAEHGKGTILDPANGKVYKAKFWLEDDNTLKVRGYLGIFYRTQTWYRK